MMPEGHSAGLPDFVQAFFAHLTAHHWAGQVIVRELCGLGGQLSPADISHEVRMPKQCPGDMVGTSGRRGAYRSDDTKLTPDWAT